MGRNLFLGVLGASMLAAAPLRAAEIEAPGPGGPLRGTLVEGGVNAPVVLILPGSGPTDRNGDNPLGVRAAPYRRLAEALAQRGVTSVRIDKRGLFGSAAAVPDANAVTLDDYVHDAETWIAAIRARTGAACVWLLGHSEGGLIALAAQHADGVCGLVLVATPGRRLADGLKAQMRAALANGPLLEKIDRTIDRLAAGERIAAADLPAPVAPLFAPELQGYMASVLPRDPARMIADARRPVLILQGTRDLQVGVADAEALHRAAPRATLKLLPDVNHVLKVVESDDRAANVAAYADPDRPLAPGIAEAVAAFVTTATF
jgi:pimeloyl-ACP methyl ester carboxylesterase